MNDTDVEQAKLQLEKERFELEQSRAKREEKFFNKNFGAIITLMVSIAAMVVSGAQVYVAHVEKNRDVELKNIESERMWKMKAADFIVANKESIFSGKPSERELMRRMISVAYPKEISDVLVVELAGMDTSVLIAQFSKSDGSKINNGNVAKLEGWLKANKIEASLDSFINNEKFEDDRAMAVKYLNIRPKQSGVGGMDQGATVGGVPSATVGGLK